MQVRCLNVRQALSRSGNKRTPGLNEFQLENQDTRPVARVLIPTVESSISPSYWVGAGWTGSQCPMMSRRRWAGAPGTGYSFFPRMKGPKERDQKPLQGHVLGARIHQISGALSASPVL